MKVASALFTACLARLLSSSSGAHLLAEGAGGDVKRSPVSKVVTLLRDMQQELEKEAEEDAEIYEKMDCWCTTNDKEKTAATASAEARLEELATTLETTAANSARLAQEIKSHEEDLARCRTSLDTATALREKQAAEFNGEEKDMLQSISALKAAIVVLSKHHRGTELLDGGALRGILDVVRFQMQKHDRLLRGVLTPRQRRSVLLEEKRPVSFRQSQAYAPQSGEIFGILEQMEETFANNLSEAQKEEMANRRAHEGLKAAKEDEIRATQAALEEKRTQLSEVDEKHAQAVEELDDTQQSLSADQKFLLDLKAKCRESDSEYGARKKLRAEEISAVVEAISILSSDEAHDAFSRTFSPALLQARTAFGSRRQHGRGRRAAAILSAAAGRTGEPKLAALAVAVGSDPLEQVRTAIDDLIAELIQEGELEIKERDSCIDRQRENELTTEKYQREKGDLEAKAATLRSEIEELTSNLKTATEEIANLQLQMKRRGEDRELENKEFQSTVTDQQQTQALLRKAIAVLRKVYKVPGASAALVQRKGAQEPSPPGFKAYGTSRAAGGAVGLLEGILQDAIEMEKDVVNDEQAAQKEYEDFVQDTNAAIQSKQSGIINKNNDKAKAEQELIAAQEDIRAAAKELETLANTASAITLECSFLIKNFDIRQEARDEEVEALQQAKAIMGIEGDSAFS